MQSEHDIHIQIYVIILTAIEVLLFSNATTVTKVSPTFNHDENTILNPLYMYVYIYM